MEFLDQAVADAVLNIRSLNGIAFFRAITALAGDFWVLVFLVALPLVWWYRGRRLYAEAIWIAVSGAEMTSFFLKLLVGRERPLDALAQESTYSFPSGHSVLAIALYGYLLWVAGREIKNFKVRVACQVSLALIIIGIGFSRLYLGVHFFSDVIAGYLVGGAWLTFAISWTKSNLRSKSKDR